MHTVAENEAKMLIRARVRRPATPTDALEPAPFLARLSTLLADRDVTVRALGTVRSRLSRALAELVTILRRADAAPG